MMAVLLGIGGLGLGCGKSPSEPTPSPPSPVVTAISPSEGLSGEEVRVVGTGFRSEARLALDGVATVTSVHPEKLIVATTPFHSPGRVDVVVTNPDGQSNTLIGGFTFVSVDAFSVSASPSVITPGGELTMSWVAPSGRSCIEGGDWVAIFTVGDPDNHWGWFVHVCGATSGASPVTAPTEPGQYEFRYMVGHTSIARTNAFTVISPGSPSSPAVRGHER